MRDEHRQRHRVVRWLLSGEAVSQHSMVGILNSRKGIAEKEDLVQSSTGYFIRLLGDHNSIRLMLSQQQKWLLGSELIWTGPPSSFAAITSIFNAIQTVKDIQAQTFSSIDFSKSSYISSSGNTPSLCTFPILFKNATEPIGQNPLEETADCIFETRRQLSAGCAAIGGVQNLVINSITSVFAGYSLMNWLR